MNATAILALDLGATTGWAVMGSKGLLSGTWNVGVGITDMGQRCKNLQKRLQILHSICRGLQIIYFEEITFVKSTYALRAYGGYLAVVSMFALDYGVPMIGVTPKQIKKHATAKGNAPKDLVKEAVRFWRVVDTVIDDNHADALALLDYALITDYDGSINHYQRMVRDEATQVKANND